MLRHPLATPPAAHPARGSEDHPSLKEHRAPLTQHATEEGVAMQLPAHTTLTAMSTATDTVDEARRATRGHHDQTSIQ